MTRIPDVKVSFFNHAKDSRAKPTIVPWDDFVSSLLKPELVTYSKDDNPCYSPTEFMDDKRRGENALLVHFGVVDIDDATYDTYLWHVEHIRKHGLDATIYQTWRAGEAFNKGLLRYRIIVPLSRPIDIETEWDKWSETWFAWWGGDAHSVDHGCAVDRARLFFGPYQPVGLHGAPPEALRDGIRYNGGPVNVEELLAAPVVRAPVGLDDGRPIRYDLESLKGLLRKFRHSSSAPKRAMIRPLEALINGDVLAEPGERYVTLRDLCFWLVLELPNPDISKLAALFKPSLVLMEKVAPFDKDPDVEELLRSALVKKVAAAAAGFVRGDGAEVTQRYLADLDAEYGQHVYTEGSIWVPENGLWRTVSSEDVSKHIQAYAGAPINGRGELHVGKGLTDTVKDFVRSHNNDPEFFNSAAVGRAFKNGFVRVSEQGLKLEPLTDAHRVCFGYGFDVDLSAPDPELWLAFLRDTYPDHPERIALLQEFFGAALAGVATHYERALLLVGPGHDGKSQVLNVLEGLFLPHEVCSMGPTEWGQDQKLAMLHNKSVNVVHDLPVKGKINDRTFKPVISGNPIDAKIVYRQPFNFRPKAAHAFSMNGLPLSEDHTEGFHRRWLIIEHDHRVPPEKAVTNVGEKILSVERAHIVAWGLRGAARLISRTRYDIPDSVRNSIEDYVQDDPVESWITQRCAPTGSNTKADTACRMLYEDFKQWCYSSGIQSPPAERAFAQSLKSKRFNRRKVDGLMLYPLALKTTLGHH